jgi:hypothetical protein
MARDYDGPAGFDQRPFVRDLKITTLYLQGEADFFSSFDLVREEFEQMKDSGADVSFLSYAGADHGLLDIDFSGDVRLWLSFKGVYERWRFNAEKAVGTGSGFDTMDFELDGQCRYRGRHRVKSR